VRRLCESGGRMKLESRAVDAYVAEVRGKQTGERYIGPSSYDILCELPYETREDVDTWHRTAERVIKKGNDLWLEQSPFRCIVCDESVASKHRWVCNDGCSNTRNQKADCLECGTKLGTPNTGAAKKAASSLRLVWCSKKCAESGKRRLRPEVYEGKTHGTRTDLLRRPGLGTPVPDSNGNLALTR
jgi:hypothetical protein